MPQTNVMMNVRKVEPRVAIIDIQGDVTAAAESPLMDAYNDANGHNVRVIVLNFGGLEYMNSSGIGLLVTLLIRANRQKQRILAYGLSEHYQQILDLTRLNEAIGVHATEADALSAARSV